MPFVHGVLIFAAACSVAVTALTALLSLRAARRHGGPEFLLRRCRDRRLACRARGILTGLASQFTLLLTYPLGPVIGRAPRKAETPDEPVVVCLHGLYHNAAAFVLLRPALVRYGFRRVWCLHYRSLGTDFEAAARELAARLRREAPGTGPLFFIGHSLGGLLVRRLMAEPDLGRRTRGAVTLGAPHRGSTLAFLALGRLGRSLVPESPLFTALDALPDPPDAALLSLASPVDNMVMPLSGLVIDRPGWTEEASAPVSHVAMLYHPGVARRVAAFLRQAAGAGRT